MRAATVSVGLVSPRSTCESIGALTPLRSDRSRSDSPADSRSAFTRAPMSTGATGSDAASWVAIIRSYVITDARVGARHPLDARARNRGRLDPDRHDLSNNLTLTLASV